MFFAAVAVVEVRTMLIRSSKIVLILVLTGGAFAINACGSGGEGSNSNPGLNPTDNTEAMRNADGTDAIGFDDVACQSQATGTNAVVEANIFEWHQGQIREIKAPLTAVTSAPVLGSRHITKTTYGLRERANCEVIGSQIVCPDDFQVLEQAKPLKICRDRAVFPRTSYETVALAGLFTLNTAYEFHNALPSRMANLPATELVVLPRVERSFSVSNANGSKETRVSLITDNLAYSPAHRSGPAFLIYPKSQKAEDNGLWKDLFLWEVPWAMSHEFGHHILRSYALGGNNSLALSGLVGGQGSHGTADRHLFDATPPMFDWSRVGFRASGSGALPSPLTSMANGFRIIFGNPAQPAARSVGPALYWGAINEGFADLYARYTRNSEDGQLKGVDCFGGSRDAELPAFGDGTPKVYDERVKGIFLSTQEVDGSESCSAPDFQGIHSIGAIAAHGIDAVFESTAADVATKRAFRSTAERSLFKGDMLLRWAQKMGSQIRSNGRVTLGSFVRDAMVVAAETRAAYGFSAGELGAGQCQAMQAVMPALVGEIVGNGSLRCAP